MGWVDEDTEECAECSGVHTFAPGCVYCTDLDDPESPEVGIPVPSAPDQD